MTKSGRRQLSPKMRLILEVCSAFKTDLTRRASTPLCLSVMLPEALRTFAVISITQPQRRQLMLLSWYPEALWRSNSPSLVRWIRNSLQLRGCVAGDEPCHVWELQSCGTYQRATCYVSSQHQHWIHLLYQGHTKMKKPTIPSMEQFFRIAKFSTKFRLFFKPIHRKPGSNFKSKNRVWNPIWSIVSIAPQQTYPIIRFFRSRLEADYLQLTSQFRHIY